MAKIYGIVTDLLKHSDRHNVLTLFTRSHGRLTFLSPAGNGKASRVRNASLLPLSVITTEVNINPNKELHFLGSFQRELLWKDIYFHPVKSSIALFISEFVNNYIRFSGADEKIWDFIVKSTRILDNTHGSLANFHLAFLIDFMSYSGIRPDLSEWREDAWFDMRGGVMSIMPPPHRDILTPQSASILPLLARLNLRTFRVFKMNAAQRRELLKGLLKYYGLHFPGISNLKSPAVLAEVFD